MQKQVGEKFNEILYSDVLNGIACAMNSLGVDLLNTDEDTANKIIKQFSEEAKRTVQCYIDEQKTILMKIRA